MRTYSHAISKWLPKMFVLCALAIRIQYVISGNRTNKCANEFRPLCHRWCNLILKTYLQLIYIKIVQRIHTQQIVTSPHERRDVTYALYFSIVYFCDHFVDSDADDATSSTAALFTPNKSNSKNRGKKDVHSLSVDKTILNEMFYYTVFIVHGKVMIVSHGRI